MLPGLAPRAKALTYNGSSSYKSGKYYTALTSISLTGNQRTDIVKIANSQIGYQEGGSSSQLSGTVRGNGNCTEYGRWYGLQDMWCAHVAGVSTSIVPSHAYTPSGLNWFIQRGQAYSRATVAKGGYTTYTCGCGHSYVGDETDPAGHSYADGVCGTCGSPQPSQITDYYLVGFINGSDYGCESDYQNMGQYRFAEGKHTARFSQDSYVFLKANDNLAWFMCQSYVTESTARLYRTETGAAEKLFVPGGQELTFTLTENSDGSLTLSYAAAHAHSYSAAVTAPTCTGEGYTTYTCECSITKNCK